MPSVVGKGKLRSSRSRQSSPLVRNVSLAPTTANGEWVEPAVTTRPSYEEHGGSAFGVLEDMQPLGQRPSAKVKARVKVEPLRKSLGKSLGAHHDLTATPEGTPPPIPTPNTVAGGLEDELLSVPLPQDDTADHDYRPSAAKSNGRSRRSRDGSGVNDPKVASPAPSARSATARSPQSTDMADEDNPKAADTPGELTEPELSAAEMELVTRQLDRANFEQIMGHSSTRARVYGREDFGAALHQVYQDSRKNERLAHILRQIILQSATEDEQDEFKVAIKRAKRTIRKVQPAQSSQEVNGAQTRRSRSRFSSEFPELIPRPSIEKPRPEHAAAVPKLRLSVRGSDPPRAPADAVRPPSQVSERALRKRSPSATSVHSQPEPERNVRRSMTTRHTSAAMAATDSDTHALEDEVEQPAVDDTMDLDMTAHDSDVLSDHGSLSDEASLEPAHAVPGENEALSNGVTEHDETRPPKRSPVDAGFDNNEDEKIEMHKRRRLRETLYKDPEPTKTYPQSHERETKSSPRTLRNRGTPTQRPTIKLSNGATPTKKGKREGREPSDSPLSDMSMSPPPVEIPPSERMKGRATKKAKTKLSPEKKPTTTQAALNGTGINTEGSVGHDDEDDESDNNDYCTSCGGTGFLLCCDGCDRAFHFNCIDPPLDVDSSVLDEPWFCHSCVAKRKPPPRQPRGLFASLLQGLEKKNSVVFTLPDTVRNYFVHVSTGKDGRFEDINNAKTRTSRVGIDEPMDLGKMRDSKGHPVLCFHCGKSAAGKRPIIPCDLCGNWWHLDCTDPPLANPPCRDQWGRKVRDWMCPLHVDHDLSTMDPLRLARQRRFHLRRPKAARIINTSLRRGQINNGLIEVLDDSSSSDEDFSEFDDNETDNGTVVRLPAKGIKLDFIDKIHRTRLLDEEEAHLPRPKRTRIDSAFLRATLQSRPVLERHTLLSLVQLASRQKDIDITGDALESLIDTLTAEAPSEVIARVTADEDIDGSTRLLDGGGVDTKGANGLASPPPSNDSAPADISARERRELEALQEVIRRRLGVSADGS